MKNRPVKTPTKPTKKRGGESFWIFKSRDTFKHNTIQKKSLEEKGTLRLWASLELVDDGNRTRRRRRKSERERRTCRGTRDFSGPSAAETEEGRKMRKETMARRHRIRERERETWSKSIDLSSAPCFLSIYLSIYLLYARTHKRRSHRTRRERQR